MAGMRACWKLVARTANGGGPEQQAAKADPAKRLWGSCQGREGLGLKSQMMTKACEKSLEVVKILP